MAKPILSTLLSNDDGIESPGLRALADVFGPMGPLAVAAPERNVSGASHAISPGRTLRAIDYGADWYALDGYPADCVQTAVRQLLPQPPDLVVSGINQGPNLSEDINYSGTVGAAREAVLLGIPALAISLVGEPPWHFDSAARMAGMIVRQWLKKPLPIETFLNVNVPNVPVYSLKPPMVTRLGRTQRMVHPLADGAEKGPVFWRPAGGPDGARPMMDHQAIAAGHVSVTPLRFEMTAESLTEEMSTWPLFR